MGRRSDRRISFPLVMAIVDGQRYLVSMLGENAAWLRNIRAAGGKAVLHHGRRKEVRLEEIPADQRARHLAPSPSPSATSPVVQQNALPHCHKVQLYGFIQESRARCHWRTSAWWAVEHRGASARLLVRELLENGLQAFPIIERGSSGLSLKARR